MKPIHLKLQPASQNGVDFASDLKIADTLLARTKGLLGRTQLPEGEGLWIKRCNSIHTVFMKFPIDAVFVDDDLKVISVYHALRPWRITWLHMKATSVFELPAGTLKKHGGIQVGEQLLVRDMDPVGGEDGL